MKPSAEYKQACEAALKALAIITQLTENTDVEACASMSLQDLQYFLTREETGDTSVTVEL
jgi:hypothetical protein